MLFSQQEINLKIEIGFGRFEIVISKVLKIILKVKRSEGDLWGPTSPNINILFGPETCIRAVGSADSETKINYLDCNLLQSLL